MGQNPSRRDLRGARGVSSREEARLLGVMRSRFLLPCAFVLGFGTAGCSGPLHNVEAVHGLHRGPPQLDNARAFTPSPLLGIARYERLAAEGPAPARRPSKRSLRRAKREMQTNGPSDSDFVREVRVKTTKLATWEDVAAYELRKSYNRRPQEIHESRLVTRISGGIEVEGGSAPQRLEAKRSIRGLVDDARQAVELCLVENTARDPKVIVDAPAALVLEQGARARGINHRYAIELSADQGWWSIEGVEWSEGYADLEAADCVTDALASELRPLAAESNLSVRLPLVSFLDRAEGYNLGLPQRRLAIEAATLGSLELQRGHTEDALAYFEDAYWLFHLPEFKALEGQALEQLGRRRKAAEAYLVYLEAREDAPDAPLFSARAAELRADTVAFARD